MPIRPENAKRYPKHWKTHIVPRIAARSKGRCECSGQCGLVHDTSDWKTGEPRCDAENGKPHPITGSRVVLTVMHLDHTPENCDDANLLHGCQQCHNRYDMPMRRRGMIERARAALGMGDLFGSDPVR